MSMLVELNEIGVRIPSILPDNLFELESPSSRSQQLSLHWQVPLSRWIDSTSPIDTPIAAADVLITIVLIALLHRARSILQP